MSRAKYSRREQEVEARRRGKAEVEEYPGPLRHLIVIKMGGGAALLAEVGPRLTLGGPSFGDEA